MRVGPTKSARTWAESEVSLQRTQSKGLGVIYWNPYSFPIIIICEIGMKGFLEGHVAGEKALLIEDNSLNLEGISEIIVPRPERFLFFS